MEKASDPLLQLHRIVNIARRNGTIEKFALYIRGQIIPSHDHRRPKAPQDDILLVAESNLTME